ncbi:SGNH/GDSL hydrolase family protein [Microbacterium esteraromaticum]|uniref:SGNH/GDSL hydrolase family protein n=1 Tax=Microbacterium esteraromaticum TaxID=57043 RepID=A0A7D8AD75_9MICO|nr:SGNH/GDSL hydrolase family protein [Microbacterium esteraromaticum]QMU97584.1 SGNH/GDSL hydrolase family protein [Microbacterium esteraromaticum]
MNRLRPVALLVAVLVAAGLGIRLGLARQAAIARRRIGKPLGEDALDAERTWRRKLPGEPVRLLMAGDSLAAGLGATKPKETLGGRLARALAAQIAAPVVLRSVAVVGSESSDLAAQLDTLTPDDRIDVAVIVVGGNDVTHRVPVVDAARHLTDAVARLHKRGARVVVGTCPDLGALRPVPQPLRGLASRLSRRLADAQAEAAERTGAAHVSLRRTVGPLFFDEPEQMFSLDRFHPSALGYRRTADALLPAVVAALGERRRVSAR